MRCMSCDILMGIFRQNSASDNTKRFVNVANGNEITRTLRTQLGRKRRIQKCAFFEQPFTPQERQTLSRNIRSVS